MVEDNADRAPDLDEIKWLFAMMVQHAQASENAPSPVVDYDNVPYSLEQARYVYWNFTDGNWLALMDIVQICRDENLALPPWASEGILKFFVAAVTGSLGRRGRGNNPLAKARDAAAREKRAETVRRIRLVQDFLKDSGGRIDNRQPLIRLFLPPEMLPLIDSGEVVGVGSTRDDALELAYRCLEGTFAKASIETIRSQYNVKEVDSFEVSQETKVLLGLAQDEKNSEFFVNAQPVQFLDLLDPGSIPETGEGE